MGRKGKKTSDLTADFTSGTNELLSSLKETVNILKEVDGAKAKAKVEVESEGLDELTKGIEEIKEVKVNLNDQIVFKAKDIKTEIDTSKKIIMGMLDDIEAHADKLFSKKKITKYLQAVGTLEGYGVKLPKGTKKLEAELPQHVTNVGSGLFVQRRNNHGIVESVLDPILKGNAYDNARASLSEFATLKHSQSKEIVTIIKELSKVTTQDEAIQYFNKLQDVINIDPSKLQEVVGVVEQFRSKTILLKEAKEAIIQLAREAKKIDGTQSTSGTTDAKKERNKLNQRVRDRLESYGKKYADGISEEDLSAVEADIRGLASQIENLGGNSATALSHLEDFKNTISIIPTSPIEQINSNLEETAKDASEARDEIERMWIRNEKYNKDNGQHTFRKALDQVQDEVVTKDTNGNIVRTDRLVNQDKLGRLIMDQDRMILNLERQIAEEEGDTTGLQHKRDEALRLLHTYEDILDITVKNPRYATNSSQIDILNEQRASQKQSWINDMEIKDSHISYQEQKTTSLSLYKQIESSVAKIGQYEAENARNTQITNEQKERYKQNCENINELEADIADKEQEISKIGITSIEHEERIVQLRKENAKAVADANKLLSARQEDERNKELSVSADKANVQAQKQVNAYYNEIVSNLKEIGKLEVENAKNAQQTLKEKDAYQRNQSRIQELNNEIATSQRAIADAEGVSLEREEQIAKIKAQNTRNIQTASHVQWISTHEDAATEENQRAAAAYKELTNEAREYYRLKLAAASGTASGTEIAELNRLSQQWDKATQGIQEYTIFQNGLPNSIRQATLEQARFVNEASQMASMDVSKKLKGYEGKLNFMLTNGSWTDDYKQQLKELYEQIERINKTKIDLNNEDQLNEVAKLIQSYEDLAGQKGLGKVKAAADASLEKLREKIERIMADNTAMGSELKQKFDNLKLEIKAGSSVDDISRVSANVAKLSAELDRTGQRGKSFIDTIKERLTGVNAQLVAQLLSWQDIIRYIRTAAGVVIELDTAMTELRKVSEASEDRLANSFETSTKTAKELGSTITEVINKTSDWSRLGYEIGDAENLAKITTLFQTVGDNMTSEDASSYIISSLQGFQMGADQAMEIVDKYNEVANNFAIDTRGIGEALQRSAASFNAANTDLSKSIALVTATNTVVQDPASVGTLWKTMSARIRGAKSELIELGEEEETIIESTSKLRDMVKGMTGFDIMKDDNTFKDIYEIVLGIGKNWKNLTDIEQASLGEALAGKLLPEYAVMCI